MIKEYNNFLNIAYFKEISNLISSDIFAWYYNENSSSSTSGRENINSHGFAHWIVNGNDPSSPTQYKDFFMPLLLMIQDCVKRDNILRARADMTLATPEKFMHAWHTDMERENIATILYVNETDGETVILENGSERVIEPKINKLVVFKGHELHTGYSPVKYKRRILINSNYE